MAMIAKINELKSQTKNSTVKTLCESALSIIGSAIYNGVTPDAQVEMERVAITNLFESLEKHSADKLVANWLDSQKRVYSVKHLGVRTAINNIQEKEGKYNPTLGMILESYRERLKYEPEVLIYEEFISALSGFNYLPAVNTELNAVASRVSQYKNDVDITKIIEVMKTTRSNYLIPLIEDVVDNYLTQKNEQNKSFLKETLVKFSYDPFIRDILNIVTLDATQLQLEYANAACDINDKLYSPILYLGESEVIFNVKGTYYIKKGNNINRIKSSDIVKIDESFRNLCDIINLPNIEISKNAIKVFVGNNNATLTESETYINDQLFTAQQINESAEIAKWSGNVEFFNIVNVLRENYDEIAELDFVKRVYLKENENYAADIFKLRDNIFITTLDPLNNKATFYRNINPIQAEKIMMEHMRFDVSQTFKDILPNKEKILSEISETKQEYSNYIQELEGKIGIFLTYGPEHAIASEVIKSLQEELEEVKTEYKNYLNEVEKFTEVSENLNITVHDDSSGKSYTVVVPTGAMAAKGQQGRGEVPAGAESDEFGTEVGMSGMKAPGSTGAASAVTFDDNTELLSDEPSAEEDKVDLGADEVEAYADKVDAEAELKQAELQKDQEADAEGGDIDAEMSGGGDLGGGMSGSDIGSGDIDLETGEETAVDTEGGDVEGEVEDLGTSDTDNATELEIDTEKTEAEPEAEETPEETEENAGAPDKELERTNFNKEKNPNDLDKPKKIYLKRPKK